MVRFHPFNSINTPDNESQIDQSNNDLNVYMARTIVENKQASQKLSKKNNKKKANESKKEVIPKTKTIGEAKKN